MSRVSSRCSAVDIDEASRYFKAVENFGASLEFVAHSSRSKQLRSQDPSGEWPWAPDYELLLQAPSKKNWETNSRKENWDSSRTSSSRSERKMVTGTVRPSRSTRAQAAPSGNPQESADLDSRMRRVLEEVRGIQANIPSNSSFEDEHEKNSPQHVKTTLQQWCIESGFEHISHDHSKKQTHHHHHHTDTNSKDQKEYNGPRRNSLTDPPPKEHVPNYGKHRDAVKMWKNHQPKQPAKGDREVLPAAKPMPRQVNFT